MSELKSIKGRLRCNDTSLERVELYFKPYSPSKIRKVIECLLEHPDVVTTVWMNNMCLGDDSGAMLAQYLSISSSVHVLNLANNRFTESTYSDFASALCINSSLRCLYLELNAPINVAYVGSKFIDALRLNPVRPDHSIWWLWDAGNQYKHLCLISRKLAPPSMLEIVLHIHPESEKIKTKKH